MIQGYHRCRSGEAWLCAFTGARLVRDSLRFKRTCAPYYQLGYELLLCKLLAMNDKYLVLMHYCMKWCVKLSLLDFGLASVVVILLLVSITPLSVGLGSDAPSGALASASRFQRFDGNGSSGSGIPPASQDFASINTTGITPPTSYTSGWTVGLKATATGTGYSCAWTFGDGGTANTCTTTHTITANGNFTWSVTVTELDGNHPTASMGVFHKACGSGSQECPDMF